MEVRGAQQAHQIVIVLLWRLAAARDPVEQLDVVAIEQGFKPNKLGAVETRDKIVRERAQKKVDLLCAAVPGAKQDSAASSVWFNAAHAVGSAVGAIHDVCAVGHRWFNPVHASSRANLVWHAGQGHPLNGGLMAEGRGKCFGVREDDRTVAVPRACVRQ